VCQYRDFDGTSPPCLPLGRVPGAEVLDHRLRMHRCLVVAREIPHRGRAAEALGTGAQLREDLLVRVALTDPGAERLQRRLVDALDRSGSAFAFHYQPG
jgi:hypothetical protein